MKISGFTFLRNAQLSNYPFLESIQSVLPICDEFIVVVGQSSDDTLPQLEKLCSNEPKIRIVSTIWNENMRDRGFVYAQQKMIGHFSCGGDWAFYLEGDEVIHENDLDAIKQSMCDHLNDGTEALYFDFLHFYGTCEQLGIAGYRRAPRIIRNNMRCISPDGLYFLVLEKNKKGRYPKARHAGGRVFHYGHVRPANAMQTKLSLVSGYWNKKAAKFPGYGWVDTAELVRFEGSHPMVMKRWIQMVAEKTFEQAPDYKLSMRDVRHRIRFFLERIFNVELTKKHYIDLDR